MKKSNNKGEKKKYPNAYWEHATFLIGECDRENCPNKIKHRCFDENSPDAIVLKSLCDEHYNSDAQKKWLKKTK